MVDRRQALAREFSVRRCFVPADPADRIVFLALAKGPKLPRRRSRPARRVVQPRHGFCPGDAFAILDKLVLPVFPVLIGALIDEFFELQVCDFVLVKPILIKRQLPGP